MHTTCSSVDLVQVYRSAAGTCRSTTADTGTTTHVVRVQIQYPQIYSNWYKPLINISVMTTVSKKTERPLSTIVTKPNGFLCFFLFVVGRPLCSSSTCCSTCRGGVIRTRVRISILSHSCTQVLEYQIYVILQGSITSQYQIYTRKREV